MTVYPKYLIRPDDHMIFSLNDDGQTYSTHDSKIKFPDNLHHKYPMYRLLRHGFYEAPEDELVFHRSKQSEYHRLVNIQMNKENKGCGD